MFGENYKWNYDYVHLACDSGFSFQKHKGSSCDKNKICLIDIDRIVREKDVASVEKFIPYVEQFILDPEQAEILDDHFVTVFRLSQLAIEYLLFCKRYLDYKVAEVKEELAKSKEENKELNLFVEDLKEHVSVLMKDLKEQNIAASFKCQHCNKIFSTEEFLNSHIKRRHSNQTNEPLQLETDKLHLEIKELKGRLNSAEKLIQKDQSDFKSFHNMESEHKINELKKIEELQQKFEDLRVQVQSELKVLQTQYNFQEKYEKLFEKMTLQNSKLQSNKFMVENLGTRRESTTQTDIEMSMQEVPKPPEVDATYKEKNKENMQDLPNTQKQINEFGEALEIKVTSSLEKIETQMQSFWNKLHDMEIHKKVYSNEDNQESQTPPPVKPRSKYTVKKLPRNIEKTVKESQHVKDIRNGEGEKKKKIQKEIDISEIPKVPQEMEREPVKDVGAKLALPCLEDGDKNMASADSSLSQSDSESDSLTSSEASDKKLTNKREPKLLTTKKQLSPRSNKFEVTPELFNHFKEEVEKIIVMGRLQDLGVSPEWKGLPTYSFQRALEIVNHKASLMKKTYPDFDKIAAQIEKEVNKKLREDSIKNKNQKNVIKEKAGSNNTNTIVSERGKIPSPQIEIRNRKMYETDSDSEPVKVTRVKGNLKEFSAPYSAVIEELKSVTTKYESSDKSISEMNSVKEENQKGDETKGVLKNYPSIVSLTKKKVLFNLKDKEEFKRTAELNEGNSTTSVTSSVLDGSPKKSKTNKIAKEKDIEDLSDFDFSDM